MDYLVTLRNPTTGQTRNVNIEAATTGQALARLGRVPEGFAIDSVRASEDLEPPPLLDEGDAANDSPDEEPEYFEYEAPPGYTRPARSPYRSTGGGHTAGALVFAWIFGAIVGSGAFWMLQPLFQQSSTSSPPPTSNTQPAERTTQRPSPGTSTPIESETSSPTFTQAPSSLSPILTDAARQDELSGTVWGLDQGDEVPLAIWRVTGQDPQTRFLYEALVAADSEPDARQMYRAWSTNQIVSVERVAWLRGSPTGGGGR
ncbi:MAG: hypothetical protein ACYTF7_04220 [Planctomycetota bacterium]